MTELLELIRLYGSEAVAHALLKAHAGRAFGSDYVANILRQQLSPRAVQPRLRLNNPELDQLATDPLSLLEYDAFLFPERNDSDEHSPPETRTTQPDDDEPPSGSNDADAATNNLSFPATLERLADLELEARRRRSIERRVKMSRLQARHSIDAFNFAHHKSRQQARLRILKLLDLDFLHKGTNLVFVGNPGVGKTMLAKIIG